MHQIEASNYCEINIYVTAAPTNPKPPNPLYRVKSIAHRVAPRRPHVNEHGESGATSMIFIYINSSYAHIFQACRGPSSVSLSL